MTTTQLIAMACQQLQYAYAPYSGFFVAAALLCDDDTVFLGSNVENASYSAGICAERSAFSQAVSSGRRTFKELVICGGSQGELTDYCPPCGVCRQFIREFCNPDFKIILARSETEYQIYTLEELLPRSFGPESLR